MLYREAGDFKTSYASDNQTFPIRFDRAAYWILMAVAFLVVPMVMGDYWANSIVIPGNKQDLAMQLILTPLIERLVTNARKMRA